MANIKSARKRAKQAVERRVHNMSLRTEVRTAIKNVKKAVAAGKKDDAAKALRASQRVIDRIVAKGILHRNARRSSQEPARARPQGHEVGYAQAVSPTRCNSASLVRSETRPSRTCSSLSFAKLMRKR